MFGVKFGERLRAIREGLGFTQAEVADRIGVSRETVTKWERGVSMPRTRRLEDVYKALGVTERKFWVYPLFGDDSDKGQISLDFVDPNPAPYCNVNVDESHRAIQCPRCGSREHQHDEGAKYCGDCGCPVYNLCTVDRDHINKPSFRRCGRCGAQTWWSLSEKQFVNLLDQLAIGNRHSNEEE